MEDVKDQVHYLEIFAGLEPEEIEEIDQEIEELLERL